MNQLTETSTEQKTVDQALVNTDDIKSLSGKQQFIVEEATTAIEIGGETFYYEGVESAPYLLKSEWDRLDMNEDEFSLVQPPTTVRQMFENYGKNMFQSVYHIPVFDENGDCVEKATIFMNDITIIYTLRNATDGSEITVQATEDELYTSLDRNSRLTLYEYTVPTVGDTLTIESFEGNLKVYDIAFTTEQFALLVGTIISSSVFATVLSTIVTGLMTFCMVMLAYMLLLNSRSVQMTPSQQPENAEIHPNIETVSPEKLETIFVQTNGPKTHLLKETNDGEKEVLKTYTSGLPEDVLSLLSDPETSDRDKPKFLAHKTANKTLIEQSAHSIELDNTTALISIS
jgi:hypothetical protein